MKKQKAINEYILDLNKEEFRMIVYHLIERVPGDRIMLLTEGKIVDVLTLPQIKALKEPLPDYVLTYDMSVFFFNYVESNHKVIWPGGQIQDVKDVSNNFDEGILKLAEKSKEYLRTLPIKTMDDYENEIAYKVAMSTMDDIMESMADGILKEDESTTQAVDNEYEVLKLITRMNPQVGEIYKIEKVLSVDSDQGDKKIQIFCDPRSLMAIKKELCRVKTKKELMSDDDLYIGDYNNEYRFITTEGYALYRDEDGYHIKSLRVNPKNVNNF